MKKIVGIIAAAALATSAFAEVNIGSWNRAVFEPIQYDGDTLRSNTGASWGVGNAGTCRSGLSFSASTENAGINIDVNAEGGVGTGDNALVWVKPVEIFTVKFGKINNISGRLDHCFGTWDRSRLNDLVQRGEGFAGVDRLRDTIGAEFTLTPVEGLVIDYNANFNKNTTGNHAYEVLWENASTMVGYKADFGFIRAIVNGAKADFYSKKDTDTKPAAVIAVGADITAVENLTLKVGASVPTLLKKAKSAILFGVGADYSLDALTLHGQTELGIRAKSVNDDGDFDIGAFTAQVGAGVDYAFSDAWKIVTDVRFNTFSNVTKDGKDLKYEDPAFGAYIGLQQSLSNATFDFGFQFGKRALKNDYKDVKDKDGNITAYGDSFQFAVPLTITASF